MKEVFGQISGGEEVFLFTLRNTNGIEVKITNYGGIVHSIMVPDKDGQFEDILLGYNDLHGYLRKENPYFGCIVGRFANRISRGKFILEGIEYQLAKNTGQNHLHGGIKGFDKVVWNAREIAGENYTGLELSYLSPDGDEAYPGNLSISVNYLLTNHNELKIRYSAITDKATPINLTNHCYFNLCGNGMQNILEHELRIESESITEINDEMIPTGKFIKVEGTPYDFRQMKTIGKDIHLTSVGYDHNFVLSGNGLRKVAEVFESKSNRRMIVYTTSPGMQLYTGNFLDNNIIGKQNRKYNKYDGFCFETQYFPDSPNQPNFPSSILYPGEKFEHETIYQFL